MNIVVLQGTLSSEPTERTLPTGQNIMNWNVATETDEGKLSVPVQWNDPNKRVCDFVAGDQVVVLGQVRRRFFTAGGATAARTEVLGSQVAKSTRRVSVGRILDRAIGELTR